MTTIRSGLFCAVVLITLAPQRVPAGDLPPDALRLIEQYKAEEKAVMAEAEQKLAPKWSRMLIELTALQSTYTKAGDLENAVAIRDRLALLKESKLLDGAEVLPDPGVISKNLADNSMGKTLYFRVTGRASGSLWGTDNYTTDSDLGMAAVHAGILKVGQEAVVKVTIKPGLNAFTATTRNGITSSSWGAWPASFIIEAVK